MKKPNKTIKEAARFVVACAEDYEAAIMSEDFLKMECEYSRYITALNMLDLFTGGSWECDVLGNTYTLTDNNAIYERIYISLND